MILDICEEDKVELKLIADALNLTEKKYIKRSPDGSGGYVVEQTMFYGEDRHNLKSRYLNILSQFKELKEEK